MSSQLVVAPLQILHEAEIGVVLSVTGWIMLFPVRTLLKDAKNFVNSFASKLDLVHKELTQQRENCLTTLQAQGKEQIQVLEKVADTLEQMHLEQAKMSGYFQGKG